MRIKFALLSLTIRVRPLQAGTNESKFLPLVDFVEENNKRDSLMDDNLSNKILVRQFCFK